MSSKDDPSVASPPVTRVQLLVAMGISLLLLAVFTVTMPFARHTIQNTEMILPAYAAATFVLEITTSVLLFALYNARRGRALLFLASGYLFAALTVPAWVLSFPGVFTDLGIDLGLQATAAVAAMRRLGFPLFVLAYALAPKGAPRSGGSGGTVLAAVLLVCAIDALLMGLILAHHDALPALMHDDRTVNEPWLYVPALALVLYALAIALLLKRRRSPLDVWVCLVLCSLIIEVVLISYLGGAIRLSVGWWAGRLYGLAAASIVLLVLLSETTGIYARLAETVAAERRARQNRLTAMEALSASIAHEINQPLASMITNADAALRWLGKSAPRIDQVDAALRRIVADGHRASSVVAGIRTMFMKGSLERGALDLNMLVGDAVRTASTEARFAGITIAADLSPNLPEVIGNAVQLHQVLCNLIENGIDALKTVGERPRALVIRTRHQAPEEVTVSIEDNGTGVPEDVVDRIFDPFVSTKPGGMGMGLMFCRAVIEAHGGRLWTSPNVPRGAVFHFSLPAAIPAPAEKELEG